MILIFFKIALKENFYFGIYKYVDYVGIGSLKFLIFLFRL